MSFIDVRGAAEHNLKQIDIQIPKNKLVVFTGVSGSGKSSLVFDTIYAESFRRFVDASQAPIYMMGNSVWSKVKRAQFKSITGLPPALGLSQRQGVSSKTSTVGTISGISDLLRVYYAAFGTLYCQQCDIPLSATDSQTIVKKILENFNEKKIRILSPIAEKRKGSFTKEIEKFTDLGFLKVILNEETFNLQDEKKIPIDPKKLNTLDLVIDEFNVSSKRVEKLTKAVNDALKYGNSIIKVFAIDNPDDAKRFNTSSSCPQCKESAQKLDPRHFSPSSLGQCNTCLGTGSMQEDLPNDLFPCPTCFGSRLNPNRPTVRVCERTFEEIQQDSMKQLESFICENLYKDSLNDKSKLKIYKELRLLIQSILKLNLDHLSLNRSGNTLSPGDLQRLRLSSMISNHLQSALYVADEPCQGLTSPEVKKMALLFKQLTQSGSSAIVVEHHPAFLYECDVLMTMGPGAGVHGGKIVSTATNHDEINALLTNATTLTTNPPPMPKPVEQTILPKKNLKKGKISVSCQPPEENNGLKNHLLIPSFQCRNRRFPSFSLQSSGLNLIRGKAGSGKNTLLEQGLLPVLYHLGKIKDDDSEKYKTIFQHFPIDFKLSNPLQKNLITSLNYAKPGSITRSSRRCVASALEVIQPIRELFASLPSSELMGLTESHYSWSSKLGRCDTCEGKGYIELPQRYSQPVRVECEVCLGAKLNNRSLKPRFKGKNISEILSLSLEEACQLFEHHKLISTRLMRACQFGLGYIQLDQGMDSLSGGELQRLTLTLELKRSNLQGAWFVLSHPSTGLHKPDILVLCQLIEMMTSKGASFLVIENREEFIPFANQVIDLDLSHS